MSLNQSNEPRRASFPARIANRTQKLDNGPRSCSANDTAAHFQTRDESTERPIEARTAFEDTTPLGTDTIAIPEDRLTDNSESNNPQINAWLAQTTSPGNSSSDKDVSAAEALESALPPSTTTDQERRSSALSPEGTHLHQDKGPHDAGTREDRTTEGAAGIHSLNDSKRYPITRAVTMDSEEPVVLTESRSNAAPIAAVSDNETAKRRQSAQYGDGKSAAESFKTNDSVDAGDQFDDTTQSVGVSSSQVTSTEQPMTFCDVARSLTRWKAAKTRAHKQKHETIAKDPSHQQFMVKTAIRIKTQLPRPLRDRILEEAYPILLLTAQAYKSQLGSKHKLTLQAYERVAELAEDLKIQ